jgi:hypothetical protein
MPFVLDQPEATMRAPTGVEPPTPLAPTFGETVGAAFRQDNPMYNLGTRLFAESYPAEPGYNPLNDPEFKGSYYQQHHADNFIASQSPAETRSIMRRIDGEEQDRKVLDASGFPGFVAQVGAGLVDPTVALPGGAVFKSAKGGYSAVRSALAVGAAAGVQTAIQEGVLQATQETRTALESATAIGSSTILGGLIGAGAASILSRTERAALEKLLDKDRADLSAHAEGAPMPAAAGAAASDSRQLELELSGLGKTSRLSPTRRVLAGESIEARRTMADLAETPYRFREGEEGISATQGPALDRLARMQVTGTRVAVSDELDRLFGDYRFGNEDQRFPRFKAQFERAIGRDTEKMTFTEFKTEVAKALQEGDTHEIPQVQQAAQFVRNRVFEPWKQRAIEAGLLPEGVDPKTAESYFQRVYNKQKIAAQRPQFVDTVTNWLENDQQVKAAAKARIEESHATLTTANTQINKFDAQLKRIEAAQEKLGARLDERAMEARRTEKRANTLQERERDIADELTEIDSFIREMRSEVKDPALLARIDQMEKDAAALRQADRPVTEADVARMDNEELKSILTGTTRMAAEMLVGTRAKPKAPSFISWLVANGGIKDVGGDVQSIVGGTRVRPGLLNSQGRTLDEIAQLVKEHAPGHFPDQDIPGGGLASNRDVLEWIDEALRGREPSWWLDSMAVGDKDKLEAAQYANMLERIFDEAGIKVKNIRDVAKVLRDERGGGVRLEDLDRIAAQMEEAGQGISTGMRRADAEEKLAAERKILSDIRATLSDAIAARNAKEARLGTSIARSQEAELGQRANAGRLGVLQNRMELADARRELMIDAMQIAAKARDEARAKIEAEIASWDGSSVSDAKSALKAREKYAAEVARAEGAPRLESADSAVDRAVKRILKSDRNLDREILRARSNEITDRILGSPDGRLPYDLASGGPEIGFREGGPPPRGPLAARNFAIPDAMIRDWLEQDVEQVVGTHLRTIVPDVLLTERFGDARMTEAFRKINDEYAAMAEAARGNETRLRKIETERQNAIRDIAAVRDRIRGVYGWAPELRNMARVANGAKAVNNLSSMGMAAVSSLPDMAGAVFRFGLVNTLRDGWAPFFANIAGGNEAFSKFKTQMRAIGIGTETAVNARQHALDDVLDVYKPQSRVERTLQAASDKFFVANLLAPETDVFKTVASHVAVSEILRATKAVANNKATKRQIADLAESGIDLQMAGRIAQQFERGGEIIDGVHLPNTADWGDRAAADALNGAVAREVDIAVVTPGQEKPLWMSHPVLSLLGQFKAFTASATERILVANLMRRDARALQGAVTSVALGMLAYKANAILGGPKTSDRPQDWVKEGISRGGLLGWLEEGNALASKATRGSVDIYRMIGADKPMGRYANRSTLDMLVGPTAGKIGQLAQITGAAASGDWGESDTKAVRRLMAMQNLFYLRRLFDQVEAGTNRAFNIPMAEKN